MEASKTIAEQYHSGLADKCQTFVDSLLEIVRYTGGNITQSASKRKEGSEIHQIVVSKDQLNARLAPLGLVLTGDFYVQGTIANLKAI